MTDATADRNVKALVQSLRSYVTLVPTRYLATDQELLSAAEG